MCQPKPCVPALLQLAVPALSRSGPAPCEALGTRCCLLVPVPPHCQNHSAGNNSQGGDGEEGAEPWSCTSQLSTLRVPAGVGFCGQPWLAGDSPGHAVLVVPELDCGPAVPQFSFMQQRRLCALRRNNADVGLVLSWGGDFWFALSPAKPSSTQPPSPADTTQLPILHNLPFLPPQSRNLGAALQQPGDAAMPCTSFIRGAFPSPPSTEEPASSAVAAPDRIARR